MTDTNENPTLMERAHRMLSQAERWGHLNDDEQLQVLASGVKPGRQQELALTYAGVLALVAIAEALADLADLSSLNPVATALERISDTLANEDRRWG
jgi:hypothetical protein